jgi:hypothetical protein
MPSEDARRGPDDRPGGRATPGPRRLARWITLGCGALLAGAGPGLIARDLLGLGQPAVAFAWLAGCALGIGTVRRRE